MSFPAGGGGRYHLSFLVGDRGGYHLSFPVDGGATITCLPCRRWGNYHLSFLVDGEATITCPSLQVVGPLSPVLP